MFANFFSAIRIAWIAGQIAVRHRLPQTPTLPYHHPLVQTLVDELNGSTGVFVHWGVYESGKSTAVREAGWILQEKAGNLVISLQSYNCLCSERRYEKVRRAIGVPKDMYDKPLSDFFNKPDTTILIDHFDEFMYDRKDKDRTFDEKYAAETIQMVLDLIKESASTQKFNVLLVVTSWERAKELVNLGCKLIPSDTPARWTKEQLETLFDTLPETVKSKVGEKRDEIMRTVSLSGTPGFLTFHAHSDQRFDSRYATMHDLEWHRGMKALYNQHDLDLAPHTEEGRFPDKNGIYHHEDLAPIDSEL